MVGIYKITNNNNGKSYIGQSIHCGKRLDEHYKGNQLIDQVIQLEGVKNFTFQILKEVNKNELSLWEDYYIMKYDTMFPNGYNKRWNCSQELRDLLKPRRDEEESKEKVVEEKTTLNQNSLKITGLPVFKNFSDLVKGSMKLYTYLVYSSELTDSLYNTRALKFRKIMISNIHKATGITDKTIKLYLCMLEAHGLIRYCGKDEKILFDPSLFLIYDKMCKDSTETAEQACEEDGKLVTKVWTKVALRKYLQEEALTLWKTRGQDKSGVYLILQPLEPVFIPENTLRELIEVYRVTEQELKIYYWCCGNRELWLSSGKGLKHLTYEDLREELGLELHTYNNKKIHKSLVFLKSLGLLNFTESSYLNRKGAKIPRFELNEINFEIKCRDLKEIDLEDDELEDILERIGENCKE